MVTFNMFFSVCCGIFLLVSLILVLENLLIA